jgi:hypothetical protein
MKNCINNFLSERDCKFSQLRRQSLIQFTIHAYAYGEQEHKKWVDEQNSVIFLFWLFKHTGNEEVNAFTCKKRTF